MLVRRATHATTATVVGPRTDAGPLDRGAQVRTLLCKSGVGRRNCQEQGQAQAQAKSAENGGGEKRRRAGGGVGAGNARCVMHRPLSSRHAHTIRLAQCPRTPTYTLARQQ